MRWPNELHALVFTRALSGGLKGGAYGAAASLGTGAALIGSAPAWVPLAGGAALVALGTVALWSGIGSGVGAAVAATRAYVSYRRNEAAFQAAFPSATTPKPPTKDQT